MSGNKLQWLNEIEWAADIENKQTGTASKSNPEQQNPLFKSNPQQISKPSTNY